MDQGTTNIIVVGGAMLQVMVAAFIFIFGLMIQNNVRKMKEEVMKDVRREFVPAKVSAQQYATANLLLQNLGVDLRDIKESMAEISARLYRVEGRLNGGLKL